MALLTPPVGLNLCAIDGVARGVGFPSTLALVIRGSWPFMVFYGLVMILVGLFPKLALWIPSHMMQ
ncbi:hypothetical protein MGLY_25520 [Neomoorella glycerini]|uniref:TRAP C4-dicarboxylate transport system permease DctM subunit domain-containing protein n=1 Tax=Neomoorella glycerini TaxID=55779 RepID=A0A6I5ZT06_9FIRM|nr:TRAP transporter large permease subunit [Moorella glycerini]QGP93152.1 hypothetical protein MGLY_25520 [Moorella glycerini]